MLLFIFHFLLPNSCSMLYLPIMELSIFFQSTVAVLNMSSCPLFIIPPIVLTFQVLNSFRHTMTQSVRGDFYTCVLSSRFVIHINFYPLVSKQTICLNAFYKTLKRLEGIEILSILQASLPTSKNGVLF